MGGCARAVGGGAHISQFVERLLRVEEEEAGADAVLRCVGQVGLRRLIRDREEWDLRDELLDGVLRERAAGGQRGGRQLRERGQARGSGEEGAPRERRRDEAAERGAEERGAEERRGDHGELAGRRCE